MYSVNSIKSLRIEINMKMGINRNFNTSWVVQVYKFQETCCVKFVKDKCKRRGE